MSDSSKKSEDVPDFRESAIKVATPGTSLKSVAKEKRTPIPSGSKDNPGYYEDISDSAVTADTEDLDEGTEAEMIHKLLNPEASVEPEEPAASSKKSTQSTKGPARKRRRVSYCLKRAISVLLHKSFSFFSSSGQQEQDKRGPVRYGV